MNDDFLILRDHLIFLFTFLTDPPCEKNTEEEIDKISSDIYAILHEEMNKDFSDKEAVLNGCMIKIEIENAKIRQLYCGSSDSWITLEIEKMEYNYFICVHRELSWIEKHAKGGDMELVQLYRMELRFLRVFLLSLATWDDTDEEIKESLSSMITYFRGIWGEKEQEGLLAHRIHTIRTGNILDWDPLSSELEDKFLHSMIETEAWCINLFDWSPQFKASTSYPILKFLDSIISSLNDVVTYKAIKIVLFKKQIETLKEKLIFLKCFLKLAINYEESGEFKVLVQAFANDAVILTFFYWTRDASDEIASETNSKLSHMLQKIKPVTPDVTRLYFGILMSIYVQRFDSHMFGQTACSFVDFLFEDPVTHLKDDFRILKDNIIFLLTFLNDPPNKNAEELICSQIDVRFWEDLYCLLPFDDMECGLSTKKELLSDFMLKIEVINANISHIYGKFPDSSVYNFPKVISPHFLDFLIHNLRNLMDMMNSDRKYAPFAKFRIAKIEKELVCLCPFFIHICDFKNELNETWSEVVNVVHLTEHVIMSCISSWFVFDHPIWYHMAYLSDVLDDIKGVKRKLEKINYNFMYKARCLPDSAGFVSELAEQARPVEINEIIVGFEDETEKIIDMLIRGTKSLDIVSIVGMGGLGKTTLARKVCGSLSVNCNFHVFAFCCVSQVHNTRRLLLDILRDMKMVDDKTSEMTNDDLAHQL